MTTSTELKKRDIFPFFDLPRELRDGIYDACEYETCNHNIHLPDDVFRSDHLMSIQDLPCVNLLLVSKQFAMEYKERKQAISNIVVQAMGGCKTRSSTTELSAATKNIREVTFRLKAHGGGLGDYLSIGNAFVQDCLQLIPDFKKMSMHVEIFVYHKKKLDQRLTTFADLRAYPARIPLALLITLEVVSIEVYNVVVGEKGSGRFRDLEYSPDLDISDLDIWTEKEWWLEKDGSVRSWKQPS